MCNNGKEALAAYADHPYDLVITDILMPQMNGIALIAEIKRINPNQKIMVISGSLNSPYTAQLSALGVTDLLPKPFSIENFLNGLQNCLGKKISPDQSTEYQRCNR
jgi:YesN/AraC family two-component response regulator